MRLPSCFRGLILATTLASVFAPPTAEATVHPDLTQASVINQVKNNQIPGLTPYQSTYNLGATGLRGWMYRGDNNIPKSNSNLQGLATVWSRQILVTVATAPCGTAATFLPDDLIVGAMEGTSGSIPFFTSDARKALGAAITRAEVTGNLMLKRVRAGGYADVYVRIEALGAYTSTAPYNCPKSTKILNQATAQLVKEMGIAERAYPNQNEFFISAQRFTGPIKALALMAGVAPGDPNYTIVQSALKSYAESLTPAELVIDMGVDYPIWRYAYMNIFLSEYYLRTVEENIAAPSILAGLNKYTLTLAKVQSRYGTYGHGTSGLTASGGLHGSVPPYGSVNAAGIAANLSLVLGKKALQAGNQAVDAEITSAIGRANNFFSYYVNKGVIPYGEHEPAVDSHCLNGKGQMGALFFALQGDRPAETKYFSRLATASFNGREEGHTGTGFNYLWEGMGSNAGGARAAARYLEQIRWNLDLERRTDGSFVYDGIQTAADEVSTTGDGSYLGLSQWYSMNPTANYILTYSLPLKRLFITGKNSSISNEITASEASNAIAAGKYIQACPRFTTAKLIADLSQFDPVAREAAATQLAKRNLSSSEENSLLAAITNGTLSSDVNRRIGVCTVLGLRKTSSAATALGQRLSDSNLWVRAKAARALHHIPATDAASQTATMLTAFGANATDPEVTNWTDPLQIANGFLSNTMFGDAIYHSSNSSYSALSANKTLFYSALRVGLKQPDSNPRSGVSYFSLGNFSYQDVNTLKSELVQCATTTSQADTMWSMYPRADAITLLGKYQIPEGIAAASSMLIAPNGYTWNSPVYLNASLDVLTSYGYAAASQLPALRNMAATWEGGGSNMQMDLRIKLRATIAAIELNPLTYNFNSGNLQGWHNRVWNGNAWIDLAANATAYVGTILPASPNNNLFGPLDGGVGPVGGNYDAHLNTLWLRSPEFYLKGGGDLTVQLSKGSSNTATAPTNQLSVPHAATNGGGWKGIALRRVRDGAFVLTKAKTGYTGMEYFTITFTRTELATLNQTEAYTLELINSDYGNWGWLMMDNVSIPGTAALAYNFDDKTLQGWNNRVWNGSAWINLAVNATTYAGIILPASANNNLFGPLDGAAGPVGGQIDNHLNTLWMRSPDFTLNGSGDLTVQLSKGSSNTLTAPANQLSVPYAATYGGGWKGVALRRASDGVFVLTKAKTGWTGPEYFTMTFTKAELALLNQSTTYTLEVINSDYGNWGWLTVDNVAIPGVATGTATLRMSSLKMMDSSNMAPAFGSSPLVVGSAKETVAYLNQTLAGKVTNIERGDTITYSKISGPSWLTVAPNGALAGTPPPGSVGLNTFVVRATNSNLLTTGATLEIPVTGMPLLWTRANVGRGMLAGSTAFKARTFRQSGSGLLGTTRDQLSYNYQTLVGDGGIKANVGNLQNTGNQSSVGVMIRSNLGANSAYVFMGMSGEDTYRTGSRLTTGGVATSSTKGTGSAPNTWVKLTRVGTIVTAFKSSDGMAWTAVGRKNIELGATCYIGLAVSSGSDTTLNKSQFSKVVVTP